MTEPNLDTLYELVGKHLAMWRGTTPLEDFVNADDLYRTLVPALEEFIANQVREAQDQLLTKMLRDNHQKPIPEMYALDLLKELRSTQ